MLPTYSLVSPLGRPQSAPRRTVTMAFQRPMRMGQRPAPHARLAQANAAVKAAASGLLLGNLALAAGGTWVGLTTGLKQKGFLSFTGYVVGVVSALGGLTTLLGLGATARTRPEAAPGPETVLTPGWV
jgi:hypothetical protein